MRVAGEHLVTQGKTIEAHDQRDAYLFAIRAVITRVTAFGEFVAVGLTLVSGNMISG